MKLTFLAAICLLGVFALMAPPAAAEGLTVPSLLDRTLKFFTNGHTAKQPLSRSLYTTGFETCTTNTNTQCSMLPNWAVVTFAVGHVVVHGTTVWNATSSAYVTLTSSLTITSGNQQTYEQTKPFCVGNPNSSATHICNIEQQNPNCSWPNKTAEMPIYAWNPTENEYDYTATYQQVQLNFFFYNGTAHGNEEVGIEYLNGTWACPNGYYTIPGYGPFVENCPFEEYNPCVTSAPCSCDYPSNLTMIHTRSLCTSEYVTGGCGPKFIDY